MFKGLVKKGLLIVIAVILAILLLTAPVYADDPAGITANVNIVGNNPDVGVNIYGNNPDVWINGEALGSITQQITNNVSSTVTSNAVNSGLPNGAYSGASTGFLPPLANSPFMAGLASNNQHYTQPLPGWTGYFCPTSNTDASVYKGSGCGGNWGTADGWPDFWSRRQIAGIAPEFYAEKEKLNTTITAVAKVIGVLEKYHLMLNGDGNGNGNGLSGDLASLKEDISQLDDMKLSLSVLQEEHNDLSAALQQQRNDSDKKLINVVVVFAFVVICLIGAMLYLFSKVRRLVA